ncbi:MAG: class I SAM-dependent methyltransferase [Planctomycetes bacterium]|nr:class I SAM-dependent methyltransferase [Planctomycetota bacterium]
MGRLLQYLHSKVGTRCREERAELFRRSLRPSPQDRILDVGGGYGDYIATVVPFRENVWVAEISEEVLQRARQHGFQTALIPTDGTLPFPDGYFDIVHCNSVIEHVLVPEDRARLASEIQRIGKNWFVQTPNKYFVIEPHTRMPFGQFLPRPLMRLLLPCLRRIWGHYDRLWWRLLDARELRALFPQSRLIRERLLGLTKSLVIVGGPRISPEPQTHPEPATLSASPAA